MLLAIDSCGAMGGVALGELVAERKVQEDEPFPRVLQASGYSRVWYREMMGRSFSESLLSTVDELVTEAGIGITQIQCVVVVSGPGSFTGIRIGVSAAKGLAEGLAIPVIAASRLELLARQSRDGSAVAVLDAGRGELFAGFYREGACETEALLTRDALSQAVAGSGLPLVVCEEKVFLALGELSATYLPEPTAVDALTVSRDRFLSGRFADVVTLEANYLRRSENEMLARIAGHAAPKVSTSIAAIAE